MLLKNAACFLTPIAGGVRPEPQVVGGVSDTGPGTSRHDIVILMK
jgi:hypothetical protein